MQVHLGSIQYQYLSDLHWCSLGTQLRFVKYHYDDCCAVLTIICEGQYVKQIGMVMSMLNKTSSNILLFKIIVSKMTKHHLLQFTRTVTCTYIYC